MTATLTKLEKAVRNYRTATNDAQRHAAMTFCINRAGDLQPERDSLKAKLSIGWDWLDANPDNLLAEFTENAILADLVTYERMEDALANALAIVTGADAVQERRAA